MSGHGLTALVAYAAMVAGGLIMLAIRRLALRRPAPDQPAPDQPAPGGAPGRDPLPPWVTASCFLLAAALLWVSGSVLRPGTIRAAGVQPSCAYSCDVSRPVPVVGPALGPHLVVLLLACAAMTTGGAILLAVRRLARHRRAPGRLAPGRDLLPPRVMAGCFLLESVLLIALNASVLAVSLNPIQMTWLTPVSQGSVSAAPLVSGPVVAGCLAVAAGYAAQAAVRRTRSGLGPCALGRVLGLPARDGTGRAYA